MIAHLAELLTPKRTQANINADSKKAILEIISKSLASDVASCEFKQIFDSLLNREKLGSTGIGHGVAIPHCRLANLEQPIAAMVHLDKAIDFDAIDNAPVDLFLGLIVPEGAEDTHVEILAQIAEKFGNADYRAKLRSAKSSEELFSAAISN